MTCRLPILAAAATAFSFAGIAFAADQPAFEAPDDAPVTVGLAGADRPDLARFLMARGAISLDLSPDGRRIAYLSDVTGMRQLWVMAATGGAARQLTFGNGVTFHRWTPDGASLLYGADNNGDEQESYYRISTDGRQESLVLAATDGGFRMFGDFSTMGDEIVYASTEGTGLHFDIYTLAIDGGTPTRVYDGHYGYRARSRQPGGDLVIVTDSRGEDAQDVYLLDLGTGDLRTLFKPEIAASHDGFRWTPDGGRFYYTANVDGEFMQVYRLDVRSNTVTRMAETLSDAENLALCGDGRFLVYTLNDGGYDRLQVIDLVVAERRQVPALPPGTYTLDCTASGQARLAILVNGPAMPGDIYTWTIGNDSATRVYRSALAGLNPARMVTPESVRLTASDGVSLQGLLYLPKSTAGSAPPPMVMDVHGGPTGQAVPRYEAMTQYLVSRGIAVMDVNVRGSTGFGKTFTRLDNGRLRLDSVRDLVDVMAALEEDGRVDTTRAAVMGGSYGGYMANAVLGAYPGTFVAGVVPYGVGNWVTALEVASPSLKASDLIEYGDIADPEWREFYTEISPVNNADQIRVPVLYSHGARDPRIDKAETEIMVRALRANGVAAPYILIPDEGHGYRKLKNRLFYYGRVADFLTEHLMAAE